MVIVSGEQQGDSAIHIHVFILPNPPAQALRRFLDADPASDSSGFLFMENNRSLDLSVST